MRVLVTGASGRVGRRLVPRLLGQGEVVRVLVRSEEQASAFREGGAEAVVGDLLQPDTLVKATSGMDAIVHLAAFFRGATEAEARATNIGGSLALARAAYQAGVPRFVYISTSLVYGPSRGRPIREDDELRPSTGRAYPVSKLEAEGELSTQYGGEDVALTILRLAFVYGDGDPHLEEAPGLMQAWPATKRLHLVHHADVAHAIILNLRRPHAGVRIYNVADDMPIPISEIRRLNGQPKPEAVEPGRETDPWEGVIDTSKIKTELGFRPIYPSIYEAERQWVL